MPTPSVTRLARSATTFAVVSSALGTSITSASPTSGTKTASVRAHSWNQFISRRPLTEDGDREGDDAHGSEQEQRVALESTRLQGTEPATGPVGLPRESVDRAVDRVLVDVAVHHPAERGRPATDAVHDAVDHVHVDPVRGAGDRALDVSDDDALVQVVQVVLVEQEPVPGLGRTRALREALERPELLAVEPEEQPDADRDHHEREGHRRKADLEVGRDDVRREVPGVRLDVVLELLDAEGRGVREAGDHAEPGEDDQRSGDGLRRLVRVVIASVGPE